MKNEIQEYNYSIGKGYGSLRDHNEGWTDGEVLTQQGIVLAYAQGNDRHLNHTSLRMFANGRMHCRQWNKRFTKRGIVTKAKEFARELYS